MNQKSFSNRLEFRNWLKENALLNEGIWIVFCKIKNGDRLKPDEALAEALCFGWIDGQIKSVDEKFYLKYFKQRVKNSNWSEKNKKLAADLETKGLMTEFGRAKVAEAKQNGQWDTRENKQVSEEQIEQFHELLKPFEGAYHNFIKMSSSVRKAYINSYFLGTKTEKGRESRFAAIVDRLNLNLNPMESIKKKIIVEK